MRCAPSFSWTANLCVRGDSPFLSDSVMAITDLFQSADTARGLTRETWERVRAEYGGADDSVLLAIAMSTLARSVGVIAASTGRALTEEEFAASSDHLASELNRFSTSGVEDADPPAPDMEHRSRNVSV
jgi:hypothetical protein